jgi:putative aminopeptidase FrvX
MRNHRCIIDQNLRSFSQYRICLFWCGGTDAGQMHLTRDGVPSLAITVPVRYLHSHTSIIHEEDYFNTVKLVTEVVARLDYDTQVHLTSIGSAAGNHCILEWNF